MKKVRVLAQATAVVPLAAAATAVGTAFPAAATTTRPYTTIEQGPCTNGTRLWVHLATTYHGSRCFGFKGITDPGYYAEKICPGNNRINVQWQSTNGDYYGKSLYPGSGWFSMGSPRSYVYHLEIFSWSGNSTC